MLAKQMRIIANRYNQSVEARHNELLTAINNVAKKGEYQMFLTISYGEREWLKVQGFIVEYDGVDTPSTLVKW